MVDLPDATAKAIFEPVKFLQNALGGVVPGRADDRAGGVAAGRAGIEAGDGRDVG